MTIIYHLARSAAWQDAQRTGTYVGTPEDRADGFIHFSTATQVAESAARHRAGEPDIVLLACSSGQIGAELKWETSRGGALFPHLYGTLPVAAVVSATPLQLDDQGIHIFPKMD